MGIEDNVGTYERLPGSIHLRSPAFFPTKPDKRDQVSMSAAHEIQAETLQKYIDGWTGWTVDGFLASWSKDCTQQSLPFSSGKPLLLRTQAEHLFPHLMSVMTDFKVKSPTPNLRYR